MNLESTPRENFSNLELTQATLPPLKNPGEVVLESVKRLVSDGWPETALEHATVALSTSTTSTADHRTILELSAFALRLQLICSPSDLESRKKFSSLTSAKLRTSCVATDPFLKCFSEATLALDLISRPDAKHHLKSALLHLRSAQNLSHEWSQETVIGAETISDLVHNTAREIYQLAILQGRERAWRFFQGGRADAASAAIERTLLLTDPIKDLDIVEMEGLVNQRQILLMLDLFFKHQAGDWDSINRLGENYPERFRSPHVGLAVKILMISARHQSQPRQSEISTTQIQEDLEEFISSAPTEIVGLTVSALHTWSLSLLRQRNFEVARVVLNGIIDGVEWDDFLGRYPAYAHQIATSAFEARAKAHYFVGFYQKAEEDLSASLNLMEGRPHHLRPSVAHARAFISHCAALRQYWLTVRTSSDSDGALGDFVAAYSTASTELPILNSGQIIGQKPKPWSSYLGDAKQDYELALRAKGNPRLREVAAENRGKLKDFLPPASKTPFLT